MANTYLFTPQVGQAPVQSTVFKNRVMDAIIRVKQDLGIDELLLAIQDASEIASERVRGYLAKYQRGVSAIVTEADREATNALERLMLAQNLDGNAPAQNGPRGQRSGKSVEKLGANTGKNSYELHMTDLNSRMPLAQQIVSKYMANFSVRPKMSS
jgi:hypothetical protein